MKVKNCRKKGFSNQGNSRKNLGSLRIPKKIYSMRKMWEKIPVSIKTAGKKSGELKIVGKSLDCKEKFLNDRKKVMDI